jgi:hypothetical protein
LTDPLPRFAPATSFLPHQHRQAEYHRHRRQLAHRTPTSSGSYQQLNQEASLDLPHCLGSVNYIHQCCLGRMVQLDDVPEVASPPSRRPPPSCTAGGEVGSQGGGGRGRIVSPRFRARSGPRRRSCVRRPTPLAGVRWAWGAGGGGGRLGPPRFPASHLPSPPVLRPPAYPVGSGEVGMGCRRRRLADGAGTPPWLAAALAAGQPSAGLLSRRA